MLWWRAASRWSTDRTRSRNSSGDGGGDPSVQADGGSSSFSRENGGDGGNSPVQTDGGGDGHDGAGQGGDSGGGGG